MSRIWTCGFEMQSVVTEVEGVTAGSPAISTTTVRSGAAALQIASLVSATAKYVRFNYAAASSLVDYYGRTYLHIVTLPTAENRIIGWSSGATFLAWLTLDSGGLLRLYDEDGAIGSASAALSLNTWYRVEMQFNTAPAAGSMIIAARIDGTEFAGATNRSISVGGDGFRVGGNLNSEAQTTGEWYFDDCAVNNVSGTVQNTYPGAGSIVHMHPDAAGDTALWGRGGTDSGSDWGQVDEITPNDVTDYLIGDVAADIVDLNMEAASVRGIGASDTITLVEVVARVTGATATACSHAERIESQASGTVFAGTTTTLATTTWFTNDDVNPRRGQCVSYTDPQGGGAWTPALLDTAQVGINAVDANPDVWGSALMAIVEYVPAAALGDDILALVAAQRGNPPVQTGHAIVQY